MSKTEQGMINVIAPALRVLLSEAPPWKLIRFDRTEAAGEDFLEKTFSTKDLPSEDFSGTPASSISARCRRMKYCSPIPRTVLVNQ